MEASFTSTKFTLFTRVLRHRSILTIFRVPSRSFNLHFKVNLSLSTFRLVSKVFLRVLERFVICVCRSLIKKCPNQSEDTIRRKKKLKKPKLIVTKSDRKVIEWEIERIVSINIKQDPNSKED